MSEALLPESAIENADDLRRAYRGRMLDPKYQQDSGLRDAELEVAATLQHLLSDLDAGNLIDNGLQFHARCLGALRGIRAVHPTTDLNFLQGVLYAATDRCRHRFVRATP